MNKAQLIEELSDRLGDKKTAAAAVDEMVDVIVRTVNKGDKVNITGFGVFEKRARAARTARNPRTGEPVRVKKTNVPAFRAGTTFKDVVSGAKKLPRQTRSGAKAATSTAGSRATTSRATTAKSATSTRGTAAKATTTRSTTKAAPKTSTKAATKSSATKAAPKTAAKATTKATATKKSTTTKAAPKTTAKKTATGKAAPKKATTKKAKK